jgi:hypothetical protein
MKSRRRRVAVACALVVLVAGCSSSSATSLSSTSVAPSTTAVPTSTAGRGATTTTATTSAQAVPAGAPELTAQDAVLRPPGHPTNVALPAGTDPCKALTGGADRGTCGETVADFRQQLVWHVSDNHTPGPTAVAVYRVDGSELVQTLELPDAVRSIEGPAQVQVANLDGTPGQELVIGFRNLATASYLQLEVIGAAGTVVAHETLDHGRASVSAGAIDTWTAEFGPDDPNCCPGSYLHQQIVFRAGAWRVLTIGTVGPMAAPGGEFP